MKLPFFDREDERKRLGRAMKSGSEKEQEQHSPAWQIRMEHLVVQLVTYTIEN